MRIRINLVLAASSVCLLTMSLPAFGNPFPRDRDQMQRAQPGASAQQSYAHQVLAASRPLFGWPALVKEARKYIGTNPTDRDKLWCATFMNMVLENVGYSGTNSDAARSFAYYGRRIPSPTVGAIAVLTRGKNGGHVGVVSGIDAHGNPIIISGNHNKRVGVAVYPRSRVIAYVLPTEERSVPAQVAERVAANRIGAEPAIASPIAELLAAIESEQDEAQARTPARSQVRQAVAQPMRPAAPAPRPYRIVQQMPEQEINRPGRPLTSPFAELLSVAENARRTQ